MNKLAKALAALLFSLLVMLGGTAVSSIAEPAMTQDQDTPVSIDSESAVGDDAPSLESEEIVSTVEPLESITYDISDESDGFEY